MPLLRKTNKKIFVPITLRQFRSKYKRFVLRLFIQSGEMTRPLTKEEEREVMLDSSSYIVIMWFKMTATKLAVVIREIDYDKASDDDCPTE